MHVECVIVVVVAILSVIFANYVLLPAAAKQSAVERLDEKSMADKSCSLNQYMERAGKKCCIRPYPVPQRNTLPSVPCPLCKCPKCPLCS